MLNGGPISWKSRRQDSVAYEDYYEHTLRDASVLTIRAPKVQPRAAVLNTGATCSASNNPVEILEILPQAVTLPGLPLTLDSLISVGRLLEAG
jgi:hypothetical protein